MNNALKLAALLGLGVVAMNFAAIAASPKTPTFFARRDYAGGGFQIRVADTNGDGIPDIIENASGTIEVLLGNGDGTFRTGPNTGTLIFTSFDPDDLAVADLNGDGSPDVVIAGTRYNQTAGGVVVCMGNGNGTFTSGTFYQTGSDDPIGVVIGDFNGDGILDLVAGGGQGVWLFTGQGGGLFNPGVLAVSLSNSPTNVVAADLNEDNKLDLVVASTGTGFVVLFGKGNGTFQTPVNFTEPGQPGYVFNVAVGSLIKGEPPGIVLISGPTLYLYFGKVPESFMGPTSRSSRVTG